MYLTRKELLGAMEAAKRKLALIKEKYSKLKPYTVIVTPSRNQLDDASEPVTILKASPDMIQDDEHKRSAASMLKDLDETKDRFQKEKSPSAKEKLEEQLKVLHKDLSALNDKLKVNGDATVELRFGNLNYDLLWQLKEEPLICRKRTLPSNASINIVIGSIEGLMAET